MTSRASRWASAWGLPLLMAAMDAAWIAPYALLLGAIWTRPGTPLLHPLSLFGLLGGAQLLTRSLLFGRAGLGRIRAAMVLSGAAAVGAAVAWQYGIGAWWTAHGSVWRVGDAATAAARPEIPALVLGALAWRRGTAIGRTDLQSYDVEGLFHLGLVAFGVFAFVTAFGQGVPALAATAAAAFPYLVLFFATSLFALPVAQLRSIRQRTQAAPQAVTVSRDWYALIAGAVAAILGTAATAAALLRLDLRGILHAVGRMLDPLLWALLYIIAAPLGFAISGLIWLLRRVLHPGSGQQLQVPGPPTWISSLGHQGAAGLPPAAATALRWGVGLVIAIVLLLWMARTVFRYGRTGKEPPADEVHDSVFSWEDLRAGMLSWLRRAQHVQRSAFPRPDFGSGAAAAVRQAYAEFLGLTAEGGTPRPQHLTPAEFAATLRSKWPAVAPRADVLTAVYSRVRYGLASPSVEDLESVQDALSQIRGAVQDQQREPDRDGHARMPVGRRREQSLGHQQSSRSENGTGGSWHA